MKNALETKKAWILLTDGTNVFDSEVRTGIMQLARELGYLRIRLVDEEALERRYLKSALFRSGPLGIIAHVRRPRVLEAIRACGVPTVLLGEESVWSWRKAIGRPVTVCSVDNRGIGQMAADYLFGQKRFASFAFAETAPSPFTSWWSDPRCASFRTTLAELGYAGEVPRIAVQGKDPASDERDFMSFVANLPKPVAFFCCNDRAACDVVNFCAAARLHVPDDVAVLGVDNEAGICESAATSISSIKVEHVRLGRTAFRALVHQLRGECARDKDILCPPIRVVERDSTRRAGPANRYVTKAVQFIADAPLAALNARAVIAASGASRSYLTRRFRDATGRTILEAIHLRIMDEVKRELAETGKPIAQIADEAGFASPSGLCSVFRRMNGISMSDFRARSRLQSDVRRRAHHFPPRQRA